MKILKKISIFFIMVVLCINIMQMPVLAASSSQDGLEITLTTDKEKYEKGEKIESTLIVENTNDIAVNNISLENLVPDGYLLSEDSTAIKKVETLAAGEKVFLTVTYVDRDSENNGECSSSEVVTDGTNKPENGNNDKNDVQNTGDDSNITVLVVLSAVAFVVIVILTLKKKKGKSFLSLCLCFVMIGTISGVVPEQVQATENNKETVKINQTIEIAGESIEITAIVTYDGLKDTGSKEVISREEWIVALSETLGKKAVSDMHYSFDDFDEASNPGMIEVAIRNGYVPIQEDQDNMVFFEPDKAATKEFVAYTTIHALQYQIESEDIPEWSDKVELSYPAEDKLAVDLEIISLNENSFMPNKEFTTIEKEQAISAIERILASTEIDSGSNGGVTYVNGVYETEMAYELNETERVVYIFEPEKIAGWQSGEIHVIVSSDESQKDIAIKIVDIKEENNKTIIYYEEPSLEEVAVSFDLEGIQTTGGTMTPAEGVTFEDATASRAVTTGSVPLFGKRKYSVNVEGFSAEGYIDLKEIEYRFAASPSWSLISIDEVYMAVNSSAEVSVSYMNGYEADNDTIPDFNDDEIFDRRVKIANVDVPLPYGFNASGEIYLLFSVKGGVEITCEVTSKTGIQYAKGNGIRGINDVSPEVTSAKIKGEFKAGVSIEPAAEFVGIDLVSIGADVGVAAEVELSNAKLQPVQYCIDANSYLFLSIYAQVGPSNLNLRYDQELMNSDNSLWKREIHFEETGKVDECTRGYGNYEGYVKQADNSIPIYKAKVQVLKGNRIVDTTYTDSNGKFVGIKLKSGSYKVRVSASGYIPYERKFEIIGGDTTSMETQLMISRDDPNLDNDGYKVNCSGKITNAFTGDVIEGAQIEVRSQYLFGEEEIIAIVESDDNGSFYFQAPIGSYELSISKDGFTTNTKDITLICDKSDVNISLNPSNQQPISGNLRAVLHWGSRPHDLDSHIVGPQGNGWFHVYYSNKYDNSVNLDVDDTDGYGPETISINEVEPGIYSYYIHNYTNRYSNNSNALASSGAYIELYIGNTLMYTIHVPEEEDGTLWHVFDYNSETDLITLVNEFSYESSSSNVGNNITSLSETRKIVKEEIKDYEKVDFIDDGNTDKQASNVKDDIDNTKQSTENQEGVIESKNLGSITETPTQIDKKEISEEAIENFENKKNIGDGKKDNELSETLGIEKLLVDNVIS